jgi:hypothetical protein
VGNCLGTGRIDGWQTVGQNRVEDVDHLPIAIVGTGERLWGRKSASHAAEGDGVQSPSWKPG